MLTLRIKIQSLKALTFVLCVLMLTSCGVESDNEFLDAPENIVDTSNSSANEYQPLGEITDRSLDNITVRGRPYIDQSLGYNVIRTDMGTALRGVSLSTDGGDPYVAENANNPPRPTLEQLQSMVNDYGFNTLHVYLEGDAEQNPDPAGINEQLADHLVKITREAKMYLIITIGNNGENGAIHSMDKVLAFWDLYGAKYKDETHVIYEAHNEPVKGINGNWTSDDWAKQAQMYQKIREVAPDTMILLGSFMSFFGGTQAIKGADGLAEQFPDIWDNAGFAFHAYWNIAEVESTIKAFEVSTDYPALLCTEFYPGDTKKGFNEIFESHHIGWTQFEWLGANDLELDRFKGYLDGYGTVWRPDNPTTTWPASGSPTIPIDQTIGLYSRADKAFLGLDDSQRVVASDRNYDGVGADKFIVVDAGDDGHIALLATNGRYLSVSEEGEPLKATARKIGVNQKFQWLQLPTGDIALRPWSGSAHLVGTMASSDGETFGLTGVVGAGIKRNGANTYRVVTSYTDSVEPLPELPSIPPGPFFGSPMPVPTNGDGDHPFDSLAPSGRLWASDYDYGGEGISYHDSGAINLGEAYRADEAVDVQSSSEGYTSVGFFEAEEWLEYSIDVAQAGNYTVTLRTASWGGGLISLESDCEKLTDGPLPRVGDPLPTPDTGAWDIWQDMTVDVTLKAGVQKLRVVSGGNMNLMNMDIQLGGEGGADYGDGCEWVAPKPDDLKVEAEDWSNVIAAPEGTVSIEATSDSDLSPHVGNFDAGDFIEYAVALPATGCYRAEYRLASEPGSDGFELSFDDRRVDSYRIPATGGWSSWVTFTRYLSLNKGEQTLLLEATGDSFNINWLTFNQTDASDCEESDVITIEAENFVEAVTDPEGEVGIQPSEDEGGGLNVGWIDAGDWMEYDLQITQTSSYKLNYRIASLGGNAQGINLLKDGDLIDSIVIPNTGGWQNWQTMPGSIVQFTPGDYVLRFEAPDGGVNLNWIKLTPTDETPTGNIGTGNNSVLNVGETINFNDLFVDYSLADFGGNLSNLGADPDGTANTVVVTTKGDITNAGTTVASGTVTYPLSHTLTRLSIRVYSPAEGTAIRVKLEESSNSANSVETQTLTTVANQWETLIFDFSNAVEGTAELNTNYVFDSLSIFFDFGAVGSSETYYWDDITMLDEVVVPISLTQEMLIGEWKLAPEAGAAGVGPTSGNTDWWVIDTGAVAIRSCLFDDLFVFGEDGSFSNQMGDTTWLETWQGVESESCGTPVAPHDGSAQGTYVFAADADTITLTGIGAHLGLPKVISDGDELASPDDAPESIVYKVMANTDNSMTVEVAYSGGFWTFKLVTSDYIAPVSAEPTQEPPSEPITLTQELLEGDWKLAPQAGAAGVGPESGNTDWWVIDAGAVSNRACLFDDIYSFANDGSFENRMEGSTWLEPWQGAPAEGCGTPVAPHDGSSVASYVFDADAGTITLNGVGAHIGIAKVVSDADELENPADAPASITYQVMANTDNSMTLQVAYTTGYWTFKLVRDQDEPEPTELPAQATTILIQAEDFIDNGGDIATESTQDIGGGLNLGWIDTGDWMEYSLQIEVAGNYQFDYRFASQGGSSPGYRILLDSQWIDQIEIPNTGAWQNWQTISGRVVSLDAGQYTLRIEAQSSGANFNWLQLTATDEQADASPVSTAPITAQDLVGSWQLLPAYGALSVGPDPGSSTWWISDQDAVTERDCLFDDLFIFAEDGSFSNQMGGSTWIEPWQGVDPEACGTPVAPHNGSNIANYSFNTQASIITINGLGAHLGIPKVVSGRDELTDPARAATSIIYKIVNSSATSLTLQVAYSAGYWTFKLVKVE
jgi:hypothetical protein